jgi:hypothetical protein
LAGAVSIGKQAFEAVIADLPSLIGSSWAGFNFYGRAFFANGSGIFFCWVRRPIRSGLFNAALFTTEVTGLINRTAHRCSKRL